MPASSLAGLEAALTDLPAGRFERARDLTERCRELLLEQGHDVVTEPGQATLVSFRPPGDPAAAVAVLYDRGVVVRELPGTGLVRASIGWWNDGSDLERLVVGLAGL
jgi:selenocysteine lyase/cysteine desulfurase